MNATLRYEIRANAFYRMTGMLAPGKDAPAVTPGATYDEERLAAWEAWIRDYDPVIRAMLLAMEHQMEETP